MRTLLFASVAAAATLVAAAPADAQYYGYSPYSYSYSPYSYGYSAYSYPSYGYSYPSYSYSYPSYSYSYPSYGYSTYGYSRRYRSSYYNCRPRRHHRNGIVYYTPGC